MDPEIDTHGLIEMWIHDSLAGDTITQGLVGHNTLDVSKWNIYPTTLGEGATYPAITFQVIGTLTNTIADGNIITAAQGTFQVLAHGLKGQIVAIRKLAARIRAVLHTDEDVEVLDGMTVLGTILGSSLEDEIVLEDPPTESGDIYVARGGQFYLMAQLAQDA